MKKIAIMMGSDSDYPIMKAAVETLEAFDVLYDVKVMSAHRTPEDVANYCKSAEENEIGVFIAAAGMAAHLAGAVAANTVLPVIGVPISSGASLDGMDALLSTVQMPPGIPVGTVGINAAKNAALFAIQMLALQDRTLAKKLAAYRVEMAETVRDKNAKMEQTLRA